MGEAWFPPTKKCTEPVTSSSGSSTDRRRSDCLSESHRPRTLRTRCSRDSRKRVAAASSVARTESSANCARASHTRSRPFSYRPSVSTAGRGGDPGGGKLGEPGFPHKRNAPSRWRLRPASRLTAAEATADRRAINLGRSVLGASGTLGGLHGGRQGHQIRTFRILRTFLFAPCRIALQCMCSGSSESCGAAEPGRRNPGTRPRIRRAGNAFVHLPDRLSAFAYSCSEGFVLPAPRARRRDESTQADLSLQGVPRRNFAQFAHVPQRDRSRLVDGPTD